MPLLVTSGNQEAVLGDISDSLKQLVFSIMWREKNFLKVGTGVKLETAVTCSQILSAVKKKKG